MSATSLWPNNEWPPPKSRSLAKPQNAFLWNAESQVSPVAGVDFGAADMGNTAAGSISSQPSCARANCSRAAKLGRHFPEPSATTRIDAGTLCCLAGGASPLESPDDLARHGDDPGCVRDVLEIGGKPTFCAGGSLRHAGRDPHGYAWFHEERSA